VSLHIPQAIAKLNGCKREEIALVHCVPHHDRRPWVRCRLGLKGSHHKLHERVAVEVLTVVRNTIASLPYFLYCLLRRLVCLLVGMLELELLVPLLIDLWCHSTPSSSSMSLITLLSPSYSCSATHFDCQATQVTVCTNHNDGINHAKCDNFTCLKHMKHTKAPCTCTVPCAIAVLLLCCCCVMLLCCCCAVAVLLLLLCCCCAVAVLLLLLCCCCAVAVLLLCCAVLCCAVLLLCCAVAVLCCAVLCCCCAVLLLCDVVVLCCAVLGGATN
jgi:hypothetical protein